MLLLGKCGAFGGIWTRDHYLTNPKLALKSKNTPVFKADYDFWDNFNHFVLNQYTPDYAKDVIRQARQFHQYLVSGDLSSFKLLPTEKRRRVMQSLSALSKYTGCYEQYKQMIKAYDLKWAVNNDDVIIARLIKYSGGKGNGNINDLFTWVKTVKQQIPDFIPFMDFTLATGLRLSEAITSYRLIVELSEEGELDKYYNAERNILEHFRFKELFIRRTKKAFMSFVSNELIEAVRLSGLKPTKDVIERRIRRRKLKLCFSDLRELWASRTVRNLSQPEIDFLQGRVSASVFMRNYFNPAWIVDLKRRALKNSKQLLALLD